MVNGPANIPVPVRSHGSHLGMFFPACSSSHCSASSWKGRSHHSLAMADMEVRVMPNVELNDSGFFYGENMDDFTIGKLTHPYKKHIGTNHRISPVENTQIFPKLFFVVGKVIKCLPLRSETPDSSNRSSPGIHKNTSWRIPAALVMLFTMKNWKKSNTQSYKI